MEKKDIRHMTEGELRNLECVWPKTWWQLLRFISSLLRRQHDYGTCVYAVSLASTATFNFMASKLGITGFQASCADMDILRRTRGLEHGLCIINYEHLLYPQYWNKDFFPTAEELLKGNLAELQKAAKLLLAESPNAHPEVITHWKKIIAMSRVKEEGK